MNIQYITVQERLDSKHTIDYYDEFLVKTNGHRVLYLDTFKLSPFLLARARKRYIPVLRCYAKLLIGS